jgi:hypothetical protein
MLVIPINESANLFCNNGCVVENTAKLETKLKKEALCNYISWHSGSGCSGYYSNCKRRWEDELGRYINETPCWTKIKGIVHKDVVGIIMGERRTPAILYLVVKT